MATLDIRVSCEMTKPVPVRHIDGMVFSQDVMGNRVLVSLFRDGVPESPGGAITANIVRSDGTTVVQNGTISGNLASVVLPASAYAVPGAIGIFVKHTSSGAISTIAAMTGYVYKSTTDTIIDPGTVVPDVSQLIALIGECEAATEAATSAAASVPETVIEALHDMTFSVETLDPGEDVTIEKEVDPVTGDVTIDLGIPRGLPGNEIQIYKFTFTITANNSTQYNALIQTGREWSAPGLPVFTENARVIGFNAADTSHWKNLSVTINTRSVQLSGTKMPGATEQTLELYIADTKVKE